MTIERAIELQERAWALQSEGKLSEALAACGEAVNIARQSEGPDSPDLANLLNDLAEIQIELQDYAGALSSAQMAHDTQQRSLDSWTGETLMSIRLKTQLLLGNIRRTLGDYAHAEVDLKQAVSIASSEFGEASEHSAAARNELGMLYKYFGRFEEGISLYEEALKVFVEAHGEQSPQVGTIYHNLGGIFFAKGDFAAAEGFAVKSWAISKNLWGERDVRTMLDAVAYAAILDSLQRYAESELIYRQALEVYEAEFGPDHYEVAATLHNLAAAISSTDRLSEAEQNYRRALAIKKKILGDKNPDVALTCNNLGRLLSDAGRTEEAVPLLVTAVSILEKSLLPGHPQCAAARRNLQNALAHLNP
jgi:tetratricopeptide (TPR) repeat protein